MTNLAIKATGDGRSNWRRWCLPACTGLALLLGAGLVLFGDLPAPHPASLAVETISEENPLSIYLNQIHWREFLEPRSVLPPYQEFPIPHTRLHPDFIKNSGDAMSRLLATDPVSWQWPGASGPYERTERKWHLQSYVTAQFNARNNLLPADEKTENLLRFSMDKVRLSQGMSTAIGNFVQYRDSLALQNGANFGLRTYVKLSSLTEPRLAAIQKEFAKYEPTATGCANAIRVEFPRFALRLREDGPKNPRAFNALIRGTGPPTLLTKLQYRPQATARYCLEIDRKVVAALDAGWTEAFQTLAWLSKDLQVKQEESLLGQFHPNLTGLAAAGTHIRLLSKHLHAAMNEVANHRQTVLQFAIRRYELTEGRLPDRLTELVPRFVAEVPLDPYTNQEMRWNHRTDALYSVGPDGEDKGGKDLFVAMVSDTSDPGQVYLWTTKTTNNR